MSFLSCLETAREMSMCHCAVRETELPMGWSATRLYSAPLSSSSGCGTSTQSPSVGDPTNCSSPPSLAPASIPSFLNASDSNEMVDTSSSPSPPLPLISFFETTRRGKRRKEE
ncbi:MAG: hypothetical protein Q8P67_00065 [archaeon]|nr:hypothetical protein [archaeon]